MGPVESPPRDVAFFMAYNKLLWQASVVEAAPELVDLHEIIDLKAQSSERFCPQRCLRSNDSKDPKEIERRTSSSYFHTEISRFLTSEHFLCLLIHVILDFLGKPIV